jgi:hypothetical protein
VYVPGFYAPEYKPDGTLAGVFPKKYGVPDVIVKAAELNTCWLKKPLKLFPRYSIPSHPLLEAMPRVESLVYNALLAHNLR